MRSSSTPLASSALAQVGQVGSSVLDVRGALACLTEDVSVYAPEDASVLDTGRQEEESDVCKQELARGTRDREAEVRKFEVRHMIADRVTCSYSPEKGGRQDVTTREAQSLDALVIELTGRTLYMQSHSSQGAATTVSDPNGGRWDCFRITEVIA